MHADHLRTTSKSKAARSCSNFSSDVPVTQRRTRGSDQNHQPAVASVRVPRRDPPSQRRPQGRSDFKTEVEILQEDICRLIQNEARRIARQQRVLDSEAAQESSRYLQMRVTFSNPQSMVESLARYREMTLPERQFLAYTIQAVSFVLGTHPVISRKVARIRNRAKQVAEILANAIGQSCPPLERAQLFLRPILTV